MMITCNNKSSLLSVLKYSNPVPISHSFTTKYFDFASTSVSQTVTNLILIQLGCIWADSEGEKLGSTFYIQLTPLALDVTQLDVTGTSIAPLLSPSFSSFSPSLPFFFPLFLPTSSLPFLHSCG